MILKTKIATRYYITFFIVIPAILIMFHMIYKQTIPLGVGMIIVVFSLPFLLLPFVFEYYTIDSNYLSVKNILGITTKKVAFADYEDIYALDKTHGRFVLTSSSLYIVDKQERIIELISYYCPNIDAFIAVLSKGKTLREDRAQLHLIRWKVKEYAIYLVIHLCFFLAIINSLLFSKNALQDFKWWFVLVFIFFIWLLYNLFASLKSNYKELKNLKKLVDAKTIRLSKVDKRFKIRKSFF